jgi:NitT/TauT family transport system ATP-binding protein
VKTEDAGAAVATAPQTAGGLQVEGVSKIYTTQAGDQVVALDALDVTVAPGEFISLVGPSGCGKSTLLHLIGGLFPVTGGSLRYRETEIRGPRPEIGMMFQAPVLFPWRTTLENVLLPIDVRRESRDDYRDRALELLELVGLQDFGDSYARELSGGMQQRAALARLLLQDPEVMLLDEPFGALDEFTREAMNLELLDIWAGSGKTVIFVTHDIEEALFLADRVLVMSPRPGRLIEIVDRGFPRPREIALMREPRFQDGVFEVRKLLGVA